MFIRDDQSNPVQGSDKMMKKRFERVKNLRKISKQYGERLSERMIAKFVVEGKVIRKSTKSDNYKIRFTRPGENWRQFMVPN